MPFLHARTLCVVSFIIILGIAAAAQESGTLSLQEGRQKLKLKMNPVDALTQAQVDVLSEIENYKLYEIQSPNDPVAMRGVDQTTLISSTTPECEFNCTRVVLTLTQPLDYGKTYMLKVEGLAFDGEPFPPVRIDIKRKADIIPSLDSAETRREVVINSQVPVTAPSPVVVYEKTLEITDDNSKVREINVPRLATLKENGSSSANDLTLRLDRKLSEATTYNFVIRDGLTDGTGEKLTAQGTVKIPGLPGPPESPAFDFKISTAAGVHQKPLFDLVTTLARPNRYHLGSRWYWEPKLTADLGLGQTKSKNSIILELPFRKILSVQNLESVDEDSIDDLDAPKSEWAKIPRYLGWTRTPWHSLGGIKFNGGPKFEADRRFSRINTLGSLRFDLRFHRWLSTIKDKRTYLNEDLAEGMGDRIPINFGFNVVPYVSFDAGGRATADVIENTKKNVRVVVPRFKIFRTYVGVSSLIQWRMFSFPMSLTLNEEGFYLATRETVGAVTDLGVDIRSLEGWHHRGTAAWDLYLDPAKRFSFNVSYENGRAAPNFEYLNKLTTGFRVVY